MRLEHTRCITHHSLPQYNERLNSYKYPQVVIMAFIVRGETDGTTRHRRRGGSTMSATLEIVASTIVFTVTTALYKDAILRSASVTTVQGQHTGIHAGANAVVRSGGRQISRRRRPKDRSATGSTCHIWPPALGSCPIPSPANRTSGGRTRRSKIITNGHDSWLKAGTAGGKTTQRESNEVARNQNSIYTLF